MGNSLRSKWISEDQDSEQRDKFLNLKTESWMTADGWSNWLRWIATIATSLLSLITASIGSAVSSSVWSVTTWKRWARRISGCSKRGCGSSELLITTSSLLNITITSGAEQVAARLKVTSGNTSALLWIATITATSRWYTDDTFDDLWWASWLDHGALLHTGWWSRWYFSDLFDNFVTSPLDIPRGRDSNEMVLLSCETYTRSSVSGSGVRRRWRTCRTWPAPCSGKRITCRCTRPWRRGPVAMLVNEALLWP